MDFCTTQSVSFIETPPTYQGVSMNTSIALQSPKHAPFIGRTPKGVPISVAISILNESASTKSVITLEDARSLIPAGLKHDSQRFGVVWLTEFQLRALIGLVSIVPRFVPLTELIFAPKLRGVLDITPEMLDRAVDRPRSRAPGYMVVLNSLSAEKRMEAKETAVHVGLKEAGLSLTSAVTTAVFSSVILKRPWRQMHTTKTLSVSGKYLTVGPGIDGRITVGEAWPADLYPSIEFINTK